MEERERESLGRGRHKGKKGRFYGCITEPKKKKKPKKKPLCDHRTTFVEHVSAAMFFTLQKNERHDN